MVRLIDADELADKFVNFETENGIHCDIDRYAIKTIHNAPTVDAVPVRHGKWNCVDDMFEYGVCSCCKYDSGEAWEYAKKYFRYCPNCGAKMDAERKEEGTK